MLFMLDDNRFCDIEVLKNNLHRNKQLSYSNNACTYVTQCTNEKNINYKSVYKCDRFVWQLSELFIDVHI